MPTSRVTVVAISSAQSASPSASARSASARALTGVADHAGKAAQAASTARSASAVVPFGTMPITSPVAGLITSRVSPLSLGSHCPLM